MNNMKKTYITPNISVLATELENSLLYVSGETQSNLTNLLQKILRAARR